MRVRCEEEVAYLPIGVLSARHGVSLRTLRFYEEVGLLAPRREGNRSLYTKKDEIRLQVVRIGVRFGFSLGELKRLIDGHVSKTRSEPETIITLLDRETIEDHIRGLEQRRVELDEAIRELKNVKDGCLTRASDGVIPRTRSSAALS